MAVVAGFAFGLFTTRPTVAQTGETAQKAGEQRVFASDVFGVGLYGSLCSGMGLSFRHHLGNVPFAYQLTGGVWKSGGLTLYDVGAELQYDLALSTNRLYLVGGGGYYYTSSNSTNERTGPTRFGAGIGYEVPLTQSIGASMNLMITVFEPDGSILPLPSLGVFTYFK